MYNALTNVINFDKVEQDDRNMAKMLLSQYNTAGGSMIKKEIQYFLDDIVEKYGTIPTKLTLEQELNNMITEMEDFKAYWADKPKCHEDIIMISNRMHQYATDIINLEKMLKKY